MVPAIPLNIEVGLDRLTKEPPLPLIILQVPVPIVGALAVIDTLVRPQVVEPVLSIPAFAAVGFRLKVITTSSVDAAQGALLIVHRKVYVEPAVPLKLDVGLDALPKDPPLPLITLQEPEPMVGVLPASVTLVRPQVEIPT